jgi:hypothetical protein
MRRPSLAAAGLLVVAVVVIALAVAYSRSSDSAPTLAELQTGVGRVETLNCDGTLLTVDGITPSGTGFLVGSRLVMTAEHGMYVGIDEPACKQRVRIGGETYQVTDAHVWGDSRSSDSYARLGIDIATLELDRNAEGHIFEFALDGAPRGTDVATIGFPLGGLLTVTRGTVTKNLIDRRVPSIAAKLDIQGGNSGGPIINDDGEVVSVVSRIVISGSLTDDGSNRNGGVDIGSWWGSDVLTDLCLTYPEAGVPGCSESDSGAPAKVPIRLEP